MRPYKEKNKWKKGSPLTSKASTTYQARGIGSLCLFAGKGWLRNHLSTARRSRASASMSPIHQWKRRLGSGPFTFKVRTEFCRLMEGSPYRVGQFTHVLGVPCATRGNTPFPFVLGERGVIWQCLKLTASSKTFLSESVIRTCQSLVFLPGTQPHCETKRSRSAGWSEGMKGESICHKIIGISGYF